MPEPCSVILLNPGPSGQGFFSAAGSANLLGHRSWWTGCASHSSPGRAGHPAGLTRIIPLKEQGRYFRGLFGCFSPFCFSCWSVEIIVMIWTSCFQAIRGWTSRKSTGGF